MNDFTISSQLTKVSSVLVGLFIISALLYSNYSQNVLSPTSYHLFSKISSNTSEGESSDGTKMMELKEKNDELERQLKTMNLKLQLAEQRGKHQAKKKVPVLCNQQKAGPFGTVKQSPTNPIVVPDETVNPRLHKLLKKVAINRELIVAIANSRVRPHLKIFADNIKRVGIKNYLVVALDEGIIEYCKSNAVNFYQRDRDEEIDAIGRNGGKLAVSALKYQILREFMQLGYNVLLSDVDIVYLQNPFDHLYRDSDIESTTDGFDDKKAYGYLEDVDSPEMGNLNRYVPTIRIWNYNVGFLYVRATVSSIELFDRVVSRLSSGPELWDQKVFNEELFFPSSPNYGGLHASRRTMDRYLFMNSRFLFETVRYDDDLRNFKPVIVHLNYHPDKVQRMLAVVDYYVRGVEGALDALPLAGIPPTDGTLV